MNNGLVGWLHHHEADGYVVELQHGGFTMLRADQFTGIEAP
jgi:hypothetical protein